MLVGDHDAGALMDRNYRYQRHVYDLSRRYYLFGRDRLISGLSPPAGGTVLEVGCGTARNLVAAARMFPDAKLFGVDISAAMLATARQNVDRAGLTHRIVLERADATTFEPSRLFGLPAFDRLFFSYSLSMIPGWREALAHALTMVVSPGGRLSIVDFGQQQGLPAWFRSAFFRWLARFHVAPRADLEGFLSGLAQEAGGTLRCGELLRGYALHADILRSPASLPEAAGRLMPS